jgi:hypothetical protein
VKPDAFNPTLAAGDLVRVRLERIASTGADSLHDYLYEVDRIGKSITGEVQLDLTHFPVDASLASVVAQEVNAATGSGLLLPTGLSGVTCDVNSSADTSVPAETFTSGTFPDYGSSFDAIATSDLGDPLVNNPEDGLDNQEGIPIGPLSYQNPSGVPGGEPVPGSALFVPPSACGGEEAAVITVKVNGEIITTYTNTGGTKTIQNNGSALLITDGVITGVIALAGSEGDVYAITVECPDGTIVTQQATLGANPFPDAQMVWYYSWKSSPGGSYATSNYVSVGVPPEVTLDPGSVNPDRRIIVIGLFDGGTSSFQSSNLGIDLQLDKVVFAETVLGNAPNQVLDVVSENIFD